MSCILRYSRPSPSHRMFSRFCRAMSTRTSAHGPRGSPPPNAAYRRTTAIWLSGLRILTQSVQASEDLRLRIWDTRIGLASPASEFIGHNNIITCCDVASKSDSVYFASSSNGFDGAGCEVMIWDRRSTTKPLHNCRGHTETVSGCCFIENDAGQFLASVSADGSMRIWSTVDGKCENITALPENKRTMCCSARPQQEGTALAKAAVLATGCIEGSLYQWNIECDSSSAGKTVRVIPRTTEIPVQNNRKSLSRASDADASYSSNAAASAVERSR